MKSMKALKPVAKMLSIAAVSAAACLAVKNVSAQEVLTAWYPNAIATQGGGAPPAVFNSVFTNLNLVAYPLTKGAGIHVSPTLTTAYGGNGWTNNTWITSSGNTEAGGILNSNYITYAVQAAPGYTISFSTNYLFMHDSATGPTNGALQYSTDGVNFSDLINFVYFPGAGTGVITNNLSGFGQLQNLSSAVTNYFRYVNWGSVNSNGTWYVDAPTPVGDAGILGTNGFVVDGSTAPVPPAVNLAAWYFNGVASQGGGAPPAPFSAAYTNGNVIAFPMTKGAGIHVSPNLTAAYGGNGWTNNTWITSAGNTEAGAILNSNYIVYAVQAAPTYLVSFFTNYIYMHDSATGPTNGMLQYSTDGVNYTDILAMTYFPGAGTGVITNNLSGFNFLQNVPSTVTNFFRLVNWGSVSSNGTWYIDAPTPAGDASILGTNNFAVVGGVASIFGSLPPTNAIITPLSSTFNSGQTAAFAASDSDGASASYYWYQVSNSVPPVTNLLAGQNLATLTIPNLTGADGGGYFVVLSNFVGMATSQVATVTIVDPIIQSEPANTFALLDGVAEFSVGVGGAGPFTYQWYFSDPTGNTEGPANTGNTTASGAVIYGGGTSTLIVSNVQPSDLTNFYVVVKDTFGSQQSSVASILGVNNTLSPLAFWDFSGTNFIDIETNPACVSHPSPTYGVGTASPVGTVNIPGGSPFVATGSADPSGQGGAFFFGLPGPQPGYSWGIGLISGALPFTNNLPNDINNSNKLSGVQFNVSTVGAKNIKLQFDARASQTASEYQRVQYTIDGTDWIDYPAAFSFNADSGSGAGGWQTYPIFDVDDNQQYEDYSSDGPLANFYDFSGFPGVANNPLFGIRIVSEYDTTATYGVQTTNNYVGVGETYATGGDGGTITFDLIGVYGDAITNNNVAPVISPMTNAITQQVITNTTIETTEDNVNITNTFFVSGDAPANTFMYAAQSLNVSQVNPSATFTPNANGSVTMILHPNPITPNLAGAPILVTVTDTHGDTAAAWFILQVSTEFPAPTISGLNSASTVANTPVQVPFSVSSPLDPVNQFTYSAVSANNAVVPSANIVITTNNPGTQANPVMTITPAHNQLGVGVITVTVNDNNTTENKSTSVTIPVTVRPNTNVVAIDYFNYDNSGPIDQSTVSGGFWQHLSGLLRGMYVTSLTPNPGSVLVDTTHNTENLQTPLVGAPYPTNANATVPNLYYSFIVNMDPNNMPTANGTYFAAFNDGQQITADVDDLLVAATNGAALGYYRLGIASDNGSDAASDNTTMIPVDLLPGSNYVIVTSLTLSNGLSSLWINPSSQSSIHANSLVDGGTVPRPISDFELRESGLHGGGITVSYVKVGTTFDSVFPSLHVTPQGGTNVIVNWSDPTLGIQGTTNLLTPFTDIPTATPPYTNGTSTNSVMFFRFGH